MPAIGEKKKEKKNMFLYKIHVTFFKTHTDIEMTEIAKDLELLDRCQKFTFY